MKSGREIPQSELEAHAAFGFVRRHRLDYRVDLYAVEEFQSTKRYGFLLLHVAGAIPYDAMRPKITRQNPNPSRGRLSTDHADVRCISDWLIYGRHPRLATSGPFRRAC
jgi:hypothetical protein